MNPRRVSTGTVLTCLIVALLICGTASAQSREGLFKELPPTELEKFVAVSAPDGPEVLRTRAVVLDVSYMIERVLSPASNGESLPPVVLNLFKDVSLILDNQRLEQSGKRGSTWISEIKGALGSRAVFVIRENNALVGNIHVSGKVYQVRPVGNGVHLISEIDPSAFPNEAPPTDPQIEEERSITQEGVALFREPTAEDSVLLRDVLIMDEPEIIRTRSMPLDVAYLTARVMGPAADAEPLLPVVLNLFDDVSLTLHNQSLLEISANQTSWAGDIEGSDGDRAVFVMKGANSLLANVRAAGMVYHIRPAGAGFYVIAEIDPTRFPDEAPPEAPDYDPEDGEIPIEPPGQAAPADAQAASPDTIDVLVIYTADAAAGSLDIEGEIDLAVAEANDSYQQSAILLWLNLVHTEQVVYTGSGDIKTDRNRLRITNDNEIDTVHALRDQHNADLVSLWVENGGGYCGIAYIMTAASTAFAPYGFMVVKRTCATGYYSFGHEFGHIMGARHDRYVDNTNNSPYIFNHGHVNVANLWRTVMAYNTECQTSGVSCTRIQYWSNPDNTYGGDPTGVFSSADNRRTLNLTAKTIAKFRH